MRSHRTQTGIVRAARDRSAARRGGVQPRSARQRLPAAVSRQAGPGEPVPDSRGWVEFVSDAPHNLQVRWTSGIAFDLFAQPADMDRDLALVTEEVAVP